MNQPPGAHNPWPAPPPAGAAGPGMTQLGEPPPEALQSGPPQGYGGPMAGSKVQATVADPGLGMQPGGYGGSQGMYGGAPGGMPGAYGGAPAGMPGAPYGVAPAYSPGRSAPKGSSALPIVLGIGGVAVVGLALGGFFWMRGRSEEPPPPIEVPTPTQAPVAADPPPASADAPAPADSPGEPPPADSPAATPAPAPKPTYTAPKPTATTPTPKPTSTTPTPKPTSTTPKPSGTTKKPPFGGKNPFKK